MSEGGDVHIVIIGSGIIGLCTAYYTLNSPALPSRSTVTLLENSRSSTIAGGASSYAGGFLAGGEDPWQSKASQELSKLSWKCHVALAKELGGDEAWGFRECAAMGLRVGEDDGTERSAYRALPEGQREKRKRDWVRGERESMTGAGGVGQIDPAAFCQVIFKTCLSLGLIVKFGNVTSLSPKSSATRSLSFCPIATPTTPTSIPFTKVVITAGPWSASVCSTLSLPPIPITNLPGHSVLVQPSPSPIPLPAEALFAGISGGHIGVEAATSGEARLLTDEELAQGYTRSPELFVRKNGWVYVAGENSIPKLAKAGRLPNKLPSNVDEVKGMVEEGLTKRLLNSCKAVSEVLDLEKGAKLIKAQFCYRPITPDAEPLTDFIEDDIIIATGHGPWGITLAPGTGKVVSEMLLSSKLSADISGLSLSRFS